MSKFNLFQENRGQAQAVGVAWVRAPGQRGLWRIACSGCGREDRKRWAADMPAEIITKKLRGVGWTVDVKSPPLCPGCARAPKNDINGKETESMPATTPTQDPRTDKLRLNGASLHKVRRQAPQPSNGAYPMDAEQPETGQPAKLRRRKLQRGAFHTVVALQTPFNGFVEQHNQSPKPFVWRLDPKEIIAAGKRVHQTLETNH